MNLARVTLPLAFGFASLWFLGCSSSSKSSPTSSSAAMSVHLVDGPISGFQEINVNIQSVEISGSGGWIPLSSPNKTINLLHLVGGVDETLANGATLAAGHYEQMRLVLGPGNTVKLADGTVQDLTVPSGLQSGLKLVVNFDVAAGTTKDVWIDFDAAHSIQVVQAGASNRYMLRPTLWAFDKVVTGSISGKLTDAGTAGPLAGATVYAETLDASGNARIVRSATTDASGAYMLDLLPMGATYYVVSQPALGTTSVQTYGAKASDGLAMASASPTFTYSAAFTAAPTPGGISGNLTPMATSSQSDRVDLLAALATPTSGTHTFIVDTAMATVGSTSETYAFSNLPMGAYSLRATRATLNADGTVTSSMSAVQPATITASLAVTVNLAL